jgi:hypothetical protein
MEILDMTFAGVPVGTLILIAAGWWVAYHIKRWWGLQSSLRYVNKKIAEIECKLEKTPGDPGLISERAEFRKLHDGLERQLYWTK